MAKSLRSRNGLLFFLLAALALLFLAFSLGQHSQPHDVDLSTLLADLRGDIANHAVDTMTVSSSSLLLDRPGGKSEQASISTTFQVSDLKRDYGIDYGNANVLRVKYA